MNIGGIHIPTIIVAVLAAVGVLCLLRYLKVF